MLLTAASPPRLAISSLRSICMSDPPNLAPQPLRFSLPGSVEPVQTGRIVDQDLLQQRLVVVDITIEQFDRLGIVHHAAFAPIDVRPIRPPHHPICPPRPAPP